MTDLEKFIELYTSVGVIAESYTADDGSLLLYLETGCHGKAIQGFWGFFTEIVFDKQGKFVRQVIAE